MLCFFLNIFISIYDNHLADIVHASGRFKSVRNFLAPFVCAAFELTLQNSNHKSYVRDAMD